MNELDLKYKIGDVLIFKGDTTGLTEDCKRVRVMRIIDVAWESGSGDGLDNDRTCRQTYIAKVCSGGPRGMRDIRSMNQHIVHRDWEQTTALAVLIVHGIEIQ